MMLMDVTDKKTGKVVKWNVEFAGRLNLEETGWTADSISPESALRSPVIRRGPGAPQRARQARARDGTTLSSPAPRMASHAIRGAVNARTEREQPALQAYRRSERPVDHDEMQSG